MKTKTTQTDAAGGTTFLRTPEMLAKLGIRSRSTLYRYESEGLIPARRRLGPGIIGWLSDEVDDLLRSSPKAS